MKQFLFTLWMIFSFGLIYSILGLGWNDIKMSNLPAGEYRIHLKSMFNCNHSNKIQFNFYIIQKSKNESEIKGNITFTIPFDDTMFLELNVASKDSSGKWKDNSFMHKIPKACSALKMIVGIQWKSFIHGFGLPENCPISPGVYTGPGWDPSVIKNSIIPRTFIYGTYKVRFYYSRGNEVYGCKIFLAEIVRP